MFLILVLASFWILPAKAQVDPSAAALLGSSKSVPNAGLRSGRYETAGAVVPEETPVVPKHPVALKKSESSPAVRKKTVRKTLPDPNGIPVAVIQPKIKRFTASAPEPAVPAEPKSAPAPAEKNEASPAVESSNDAETVADVSSPARVQIDLLTGLAHEDAQSNSVYRQFSLTSPVAGIGGTVWVSGRMGFAGHYQTTLSADVASATDANSRSPVTAEWSDLHWKFRKTFGSNDRDPELEYGLAYFENGLKAPSDDATRSSLKTSGFGLEANLKVHGSGSSTWMFGTAIYPRTRHSETPGASGLQSGSEPESSRLDFSFGSDFRLAAAQSIFWDLSMNLEKNQFGGSSNLNEPNGSPAKNVSVMTTTLFFHLGYRWGR